MVEPLRKGLRELGWVEGRDIVSEMRFADNQHNHLPQLAAELVASRIDLLATHGIPGTRAAKGATSTIPILMTRVADPMAAKRLHLLKDLLPDLGRAAMLSNPRNAAFSQAMYDAMSAAASLRVQLQRFDAADPKDYAQASAAMAAQRMQAVAITEEATLIAHADALATLARQHRLPSVGNAEYAQAGGLVGYAANRDAIFRRAAVLADKLLRGAEPAELPIEQPVQFDLVLNARTAAAIGVEVPAPLWLRADVVIA